MQLSIGGCVLTYRDTPWDQLVLGVPTNEIVSVTATSPVYGSVLDEFCRVSDKQRIRFTAVRCPSTNPELLAALAQRGFKLVGVYPNVARKLEWWTHDYPDEALTIRPMEVGDLPRIRALITSGWRFGPFFDDPEIPDVAARERMCNRVDDLFTDALCVVGMKDGMVQAFMAYEWQEQVVNLILGGIVMGTGLGKAFWGAVIDQVRAEGAKVVIATISATNIGVMNLYSALGFHYTASNLALHRHT